MIISAEGRLSSPLLLQVTDVTTSVVMLVIIILKNLFKTPFTRYRYETLSVKNHYVFNYSHGTGRVILVTTFVHFIIEIRTLKCFA